MRKLFYIFILMFALKATATNWTNYPFATFMSDVDTFLIAQGNTNKQIQWSNLQVFIYTNMLARIAPSNFITSPRLAASNYVAYAYSGYTNVGNLATTLVIGIGHTMPSTNYTPNIAFLGATPGAIQVFYTGITTTSFTINLTTGIAGGEDLRWSVLLNP